MPIRFEITFLLRTCYRPLEQLATVCGRLCYCSINQSISTNHLHKNDQWL